MKRVKKSSSLKVLTQNNIILWHIRHDMRSSIIGPHDFKLLNVKLNSYGNLSVPAKSTLKLKLLLVKRLISIDCNKFQQ